MIYSWDILDFRGKSKGYFWETLGFRGKMSQVFRRQKLKMMGYPMELLHEMIVFISKHVVFRSTIVEIQFPKHIFTIIIGNIWKCPGIND